jgi:hypothetical protein
LIGSKPTSFRASDTTRPSTHTPSSSTSHASSTTCVLNHMRPQPHASHQIPPLVTPLVTAP